jgi:hypothetical protein
MKFKLTCQVTVSAYTEVEADTLEEAIEEAKAREVVLEGPGSRADVTQQWVIDEADGECTNIHQG